MKTTRGKVGAIYFGARVDADVIRRIRQRARENDRTIGAEMGRVLRNALDGVHQSAADVEDAKRDRTRMKSLEKLVDQLKADLNKKEFDRRVLGEQVKRLKAEAKGGKQRGA